MEDCMNTRTVSNSGIRTLVLFALSLALTGCGAKDAALSAKIKSLTTTPDAEPTVGPYSIRKGTGVDTDSVGGVDDVQAHQTSSGITVSNVSINGTYEKTEATSSRFKVNGGIYVQ
jgi:hypothetical protein